MLRLILVALALAPLPAADAVDAMVDRAVVIQTALAADKLDGVADAAARIAAEAKPLGKPGEKIAAGAAELQQASNAAKIADARTAFGKMSEALIAYLDAEKRKPGAGIRVAVCPMINKPWLQKDGTVQNPYYGKQMLTCGSFKK